MALFGSAHERGVEVMLDGEYGESALSRRAHFATPMNRMRAASRGLRQRLRLGGGAPSQRFMVRLAPQFVTGLPAALREAAPTMPTDLVSPSRPMGFTKGQPGFGAFPTADTGFVLRRANPCLGDIELLRLVGGMPASFLLHDGYDRALIRAMLAGRVPDETRLRTEKRAFSPDYNARLMREAAPLQSRLDAWRAAGGGEMLDLDWMASLAEQLAGGDLPPPHIVAEFHLTAMAAEFLLWWAGQG
jgi:asparagine synthase (glutamine-hydrolysing)